MEEEKVRFEDLNLAEEILWGLQDCGFESPTPIQAQAIPIINEGKDLIGCAQTGTGKTGAFLIPLMSAIQRSEQGPGIKVVVLVPTRELAQQIDEQAEGFGYHSNVMSVPVYGGSKGDNFSNQKGAITSGADIIVATPGRLIQHITLGYADFSKVQYLVLDEADRMLDMGFYADIMRIISYFPKERQNLMFSATMPPRIRQLAGEILHNPEQINLGVSKPAAGVDQSAWLVNEKDKMTLLEHVMESRDIRSMIIFASRKSTVDQVERQLKRKGMDILGMHSDREQEERERIMLKFKNKQVKVLVATDILSRGIDVDNLSHVLNWDVPSDAEDYVHRVGRTARAETTGEAMTFINSDDIHKFKRIERLIEATVPKLPLPEGLSGPDYERGGGSDGGREGGKGRGGRRDGRGGKGGGGKKGGRGKFRGKGQNNAGKGDGPGGEGQGKSQGQGGGGKRRSRGGRNRKRGGQGGQGGEGNGPNPQNG